MQFLDSVQSFANDLSYQLVTSVNRHSHLFASACSLEQLFITLLIPLVVVANIETVSMDSNLQAFNRHPTEGSFEALAFQLAAFTEHLNEVFLSY